MLIGFSRRFDANLARVHQAVASGEIETPNLMRIVSRHPEPLPLAYARVSGGIFLDMTIHDFDMPRFLIGDEVEEIYTAAGVMVDPAIGEADDLDTSLVVPRSESGAVGVIDNSLRASYGCDQRVEVFGSLGRIETDNCYPNAATLSVGKSACRDLPLNFFMERYRESFAAELQFFVTAVCENRTTEVTGMVGRVPAQIALATRKSYDERRPVGLDEISA